MTCERRYTASTIAEMQRIEDARRWQKLRDQLSELLEQHQHRDVSSYDTGAIEALETVGLLIDELSPPVVCDETEEA
jgi:hypothetical protein